MPLDQTLSRRQLGLGLISTLALAGCSGGPTPSASKRARGAALLLPTTGAQAALGKQLQSAAEIGGRRLPIYDTASTPEGAAQAAANAVSDGASVLAGPLFAASTRAVLQAVPRDVPVLSLSNDATLGPEGAFVLGVTPFQSTSTILDFSAKRGIQTVVVMAPDTAFGQRFVQAAKQVGASRDLRVGARLTNAGVGSDLLSDLRNALNGRLPDTVYLPSGGPSLGSLADAVDRTGSPIIGSTQWNGNGALASSALEGAFFSSPDPATFQPFSLKYKDRFKSDPGIVAAIAHDAAQLAKQIEKSKKGARAALLASKGHEGALGRFRFAANGQAQRELSVLQLQGGSPFVVSA